MAILIGVYIASYACKIKLQSIYLLTIGMYFAICLASCMLLGAVIRFMLMMPTFWQNGHEKHQT